MKRYLDEKRPRHILIILILGILGLIPVLTTKGSLETNISVKILDLETGYCGGEINNSGTITQWDSINIILFTLGIANLDDVPHTLEQVNSTMSGHKPNYSEFTVLELPSEEFSLPVTLGSHRYWQGKFTCPPCTESISLKILVDKTIIDFGIISTHEKGYMYFQDELLTTWSNVHHFTYISITPASIGPTAILVGVVLIFLRRMTDRTQKR